MAKNVGLDLQDTGALGPPQRQQHNVPQDSGRNQFAENCKSIGFGNVEMDGSWQAGEPSHRVAT